MSGYETTFYQGTVNTGIAAPYIKGAGWTFSIAQRPNEARGAIAVYCARQAELIQQLISYPSKIIRTNNSNAYSLLVPCFYQGV